MGPPGKSIAIYKQALLQRAQILVRDIIIEVLDKRNLFLFTHGYTCQWEFFLPCQTRDNQGVDWCRLREEKIGTGVNEVDDEVDEGGGEAGQDQGEVVLHAGGQGEQARREAENQVDRDRSRGWKTSCKEGAQNGGQLLKLSVKKGGLGNQV